MKDKKPFSIQPHDRRMKTFQVYAPDDFTIYIDYDDVDHKATDRAVKKMVKILNAHWADKAPK